MAVGALLFLTLALFAVGQAAATRNGAQTAADAAALAWAQDARDQLRTRLLDAIDSGARWEDLLDGDGFIEAVDCAAAEDFADRNGAIVKACHREFGLENQFAVKVETRHTVGKSVIPGTENARATAKATAVIEPRCRLRPDDGRGRQDKDKAPIEFVCDGRDWSIDPGKGGPLPSVADLFSVHLSE